jgi:hypothetical protein
MMFHLAGRPLSATRVPRPWRDPDAAPAPARIEREKAVALTHDPTGDFAAGMRLGPPEVARGLALGVWAAGTEFDYRGRRLTVGADNRLVDAAGQEVTIAPGFGR